MNRRIRTAAAALALSAFVWGCDGGDDLHRFSFETMGTVASGQVYVWDRTIDREPGELVQATFDSINLRLSSWRGDSELGRLNAAPADSPVVVSKWLSECLRVAEGLRDVSGGAFDPTAEPLMRLWGFYRRQGHLPVQGEIDSCRALLGGYTHDPFRDTVTKLRAETRFDLGGVAKGFAVDRAVANLVELGISSALIDLGGNLFCLGLPDGRDVWRVGVRDPLDKSRIFATLGLVNRAVATSGAYERFVEIDGRRYGHIMNPATGRPAEGLLSVTVVTRSATQADGLSTTLYVLGPEAAIDLLRKHFRQVEAILVLPGADATQARVLATPGLRGNLELRDEYRGRYSLEFLRF
jgi:thiamine biosynthesis lipoprotein